MSFFILYLAVAIFAHLGEMTIEYATTESVGFLGMENIREQLSGYIAQRMTMILVVAARQYFARSGDYAA